MRQRSSTSNSSVKQEATESAPLRVELHARDALVAAGTRLSAVLLAGTVLGALVALSCLPKPRALETMEEAVLTAKAALARSAVPARWIVIGDSACLMNLDARALAARTGQEALNLGTWRYLTFDAYAALLRARIEAGHPPDKILLIVHPSTLRRSASDPASRELLEALLREAPRPRRGILAWTLGVTDAARDRLLNRVLIRPLPQPYARRYGHTRHLARELMTTRGFLPAPDTASERIAQRPEYALAPALSPALAEFRAAAGAAEILVALSPTRKSDALSDTERRVALIGSTLAEALQPARFIEGPAVEEDDGFFDAIHLTEAGRERWQQRVLNEALTVR